MQTKTENWIVAIVFSNWMLSKILEFFKDYLDCTEADIGMAKIERFRDTKTGEMKDSNRTLILMKKEVYERAIKAGLDMPQPNLDFRIGHYIISENRKPPTNYTSNLYLIIPKNVTTVEAEHSILEKMNKMVSFQMLERNDYSLTIPLESRLTGEHKGYCYLSFTDKLSITTKILIKALLNDSFIYISSLNKLCHLPVFWAKNTKSLPPIPKVIKILKRE